MAKDNQETGNKTINMQIDGECWQKVGILAALEDSTKKSIVEKAIDQYYQSKKGVVV